MPSTIVRNNANIRNRYNQVPHLPQDTEWESDKTQESITHKIPFPSVDNKTARHRLDSMSNTNRKMKTNKRSYALEWSVSLGAYNGFKISQTFPLG